MNAAFQTFAFVYVSHRLVVIFGKNIHDIQVESVQCKVVRELYIKSY